MGNYASKVIAIALAEVGYLEKSAAAWEKYGKDCLYNKTAYAGFDNYTKYGVGDKLMSDSARYNSTGNGWEANTIAHIFSYLPVEELS